MGCALFPACDVAGARTGRGWCGRKGSNLRHRRCKRRALPLSYARSLRHRDAWPSSRAAPTRSLEQFPMRWNRFAGSPRSFRGPQAATCRAPTVEPPRHVRGLTGAGRSITCSQAHKGGVAQSVRALACHARGRGFKSRHSRHSHPRSSPATVPFPCAVTPRRGESPPQRARSTSAAARIAPVARCWTTIAAPSRPSARSRLIGRASSRPSPDQRPSFVTSRTTL